MIWNCISFKHRTKAAYDTKMQKSSKSTEFRVPLSVCTMFNILMDAKKQYSKLCILDQGQEVNRSPIKAVLHLHKHNSHVKKMHKGKSVQ